MNLNNIADSDEKHGPPKPLEKQDMHSKSAALLGDSEQEVEAGP